MRSSVLTSARAWEEYGLFVPTLINAAGIAAYLSGVSPHRIALWRTRIAPSRRSPVAEEQER